MDETYIMNQVKETCCFVSTDFGAELETSRYVGSPSSTSLSHLLCRKYRAGPPNPIIQEYILPDFSARRQGRIKTPNDIISDTDQILVMNSERFAVPEILFNPTDIGERNR